MKVDWNMNLHSFKETRRLKPIEWIEPKRSPVLKHSTFMTSKKWFQRIGDFDESFGAVDMTEIGKVRTIVHFRTIDPLKDHECSFFLKHNPTLFCIFGESSTWRIRCDC